MAKASAFVEAYFAAESDRASGSAAPRPPLMHALPDAAGGQMVAVLVPGTLAGGHARRESGSRYQNVTAFGSPAHSPYMLHPASYIWNM